MTIATARRFEDDALLYDEDETSAPRKGAADARYMPSPWLRYSPQFFEPRMQRLEDDEIGLLMRLINRMHEYGEPILCDDRLVKSCKSTKKTFRRKLDALIAEGMITEKNGRLWSDFIEDEIAYRGKISEKNRENISKRYGKGQQNQRPASTTVCNRDKSKEVPSVRKEPSSYSSTMDNEDRAPERATSRSDEGPPVKHRYQVGDQFGIEGYDLCEVDRILKDRIIVRSGETGEYLRITLNQQTGRIDLASKEVIEYDEWEDEYGTAR
jgi:hypothetical protein